MLQELWGELRRMWAETDPDLYVRESAGPTLCRLDDDRTEFCWKGAPFLLDSRSRAITRDGRVLARYDAIRWVRISERKDEDGTMSWSVMLEIGLLRNVVIGRTCDGADASIAAAHFATVTGKKVRVL
jgi:hypothetical protein